MNRIFTIIVVSLITASAWSQSPKKMSYQAVIRNASNVLVTSTAVGMQISILQGSASGNSVYTETQTPTTNANGLVSLEIGTGAGTDDFSAINWANGSYFIKTETDPTGGTSYSITGTSQLMSVPYALHATTAENIANDLVDDADADATNEIQALRISNDTIYLSNGGFVKLPINGTELPTGGTNGQVLNTDGSGNYSWINQDTELPTGGTNSQVLNTDGSGNYSWVNQTNDTKLDSTGIAALGYVAGPYLSGSDKQITFNDEDNVGTDVDLVYDKTTNRMAIGTSTISNNSALEINSTSGGLMLPRMTTAQRDAISDPKVGLMIFNTDSGDFQGYAGFNNGIDLTIDDSTFLGNLSLAGQSFTAISNGLWTEIILDFNTGVTGTLNIYAGNTVTGTPIHTQPYTVSAGKQSIVLTAPIQLVSGQQYSIFLNATCAYYPFSTYAGGNSFTTTLAFPGDLWMQIITGNADWKNLHN